MIQFALNVTYIYSIERSVLSDLKLFEQESFGHIVNANIFGLSSGQNARAIRSVAQGCESSDTANNQHRKGQDFSTLTFPLDFSWL
jgi:hypothetical protein